MHWQVAKSRLKSFKSVKSVKSVKSSQDSQEFIEVNGEGCALWMKAGMMGKSGFVARSGETLVDVFWSTFLS